MSQRLGATVLALALLFAAWLTLRFIPNHSVGVVEKLWSAKGSVPEGQILALNGEAGFQADLLRGGIHFGLWRWRYKVTRVPMVVIQPIGSGTTRQVPGSCARPCGSLRGS